MDVAKEVSRARGWASRLHPGCIRGPTTPPAAPRALSTGMGHPASPWNTRHLPETLDISPESLPQRHA